MSLHAGRSSNPFLIYQQQQQQEQYQQQARSMPAARGASSGARQQQQPERAQDSLLVCPDGWQQHSTQCYKFFHQRHSWQRAREICERHGAQLALVYDYQQNNFTGQLAAAALSSPNGPAGLGPAAGDPSNGAPAGYGGIKPGPGPATGHHHHHPLYASDERSYWIGFRAIDRLETNTLESAANTFVSKYVGFWDYDEPRVSQGECVRATVRHESGPAAHQLASSAYRLIQPTGE
jgi:hypothetical protein